VENLQSQGRKKALCLLSTEPIQHELPFSSHLFKLHGLYLSAIISGKNGAGSPIVAGGVAKLSVAIAGRAE
jgi:hypothetical protein